MQDLVLLEEEDTLRKGVKIIDISGEIIGSFVVDLFKDLISRFLKLSDLVSASSPEEDLCEVVLKSHTSSKLELSRSSTEILGIYLVEGY